MVSFFFSFFFKGATREYPSLYIIYYIFCSISFLFLYLCFLLLLLLSFYPHVSNHISHFCNTIDFIDIYLTLQGHKDKDGNWVFVSVCLVVCDSYCVLLTIKFDCIVVVVDRLCLIFSRHFYQWHNCSHPHLVPPWYPHLLSKYHHYPTLQLLQDGGRKTR